jgi:hypothetical protein
VCFVGLCLQYASGISQPAHSLCCPLLSVQNSTSTVSRDLIRFIRYMYLYMHRLQSTLRSRHSTVNFRSAKSEVRTTVGVLTSELSQYIVTIQYDGSSTTHLFLDELAWRLQTTLSKPSGGCRAVPLPTLSSPPLPTPPMLLVHPHTQRQWSVWRVMAWHNERGEG